MDVDAITGKRAEPERFGVTSRPTRSGTSDGNHLTDIEVDLRRRVPRRRGRRRGPEVLPGGHPEVARPAVHGQPDRRAGRSGRHPLIGRAPEGKAVTPGARRCPDPSAPRPRPRRIATSPSRSTSSNWPRSRDQQVALPAAVHPDLRAVAGRVPVPAPDRAGPGSAPGHQPDGDRGLPRGRLHQPGLVQQPVHARSSARPRAPTSGATPTPARPGSPAATSSCGGWRRPQARRSSEPADPS